VSRLVFAVAASLVTLGAASAADLAPRIVAPPAPVYLPFSWTGFYVGAHAGYQWGEDQQTEYVTANGLPTGFFQRFDSQGGFGGLHAGYNYQMGSFVLGIEGGAALGRSSGGFTVAGNQFDARQTWEATFRGRLGVTPMDRLMLYATGGAAFSEFKYRYVSLAGAVAPADASTAKAGWTLGGGAEYAVTDHVTARVEYRYTDFGNASFDWPSVGGTYTQRPRFNEVLAGISYKF